MDNLLLFISRYWFSFILLGIVGLATWRVYRKWYKLKV